MPELPWSQIGLFALEGAIVAVVLIGLFRLRRVAGLSPLYITLGALQHLQVTVAVAVYVEITPDLLVTPASAVLFPASLFAILLVYLRHDATEARRLVYGLVLANLSLALLSWLVVQHLEGAAGRGLVDLPLEYFVQNLRVLIAGTATLFLDVLLLIVLYEALSRALGRWRVVHLFATLAATLVFDSLVFVTGAFLGSPEFGPLLRANLVGKIAMALPYSLVLAIYLRSSKGEWRETLEILPRQVRRLDLFRRLSFRERYVEAREAAVRDALTGLHNRRFLEETLPMAVAHAQRTGEPLSVLMMDLDGFKQINDRFGHRAGDTVLRHVAAVLQRAARAQDLICRYGGDEIVLLMPGAGPGDAESLCQRIRDELALAPPPLTEAVSVRPTVSTGAASLPEDGSTPAELLERADLRLYAGRGRA